MIRFNQFNFLRLPILLICLTILFGCGGGGGGSSSGNSISKQSSSSSNTNQSNSSAADDFGLVFELSKLTFHQSVYHSSLVKLRADYTGTVPNSGELFVIISYPQEHIDSVYYGLGAASADLDVKTRSDLMPGDYEGSLRIDVCSDEQCQKSVGRSPFFLPYHIAVPALNPVFTLEAQPAGVEISNTFDSISNEETLNLTYVKGEQDPRFHLSIQAPSGYDDVQLPPDLIQYFKVVEIGDNNFEFQSPGYDAGQREESFELLFTHPEEETRAVNLRVSSKFSEQKVSAFSVEPAIAYINYFIDHQNINEVLLNIKLPPGINQYKVTYGDANWLTKYAEPNNRVGAFTAGLAPGSYTSWLKIHVEGYDPITVPVFLSINNRNIFGVMYPMEVDIKSKGLKIFPQVREVYSAFDWTLSSDVNWIAPKEQQGIYDPNVPQPMEFNFPIEALRKLENGRGYSSHVTVRTNDAQNPIAYKPINFFMYLPEIKEIEPRVATSSQALTLRVRANYMNLGESVYIGDEAYVLETKADEEGFYTLPIEPLSAGKYKVAAYNEFGIETAFATLTIE
jgi:hypothetical protein